MRPIREKMQELGLEAFFVLTKINRQYLSGFTGSSGILAVTRKGAELYVDGRYLLRARRESDLRVRDVSDLQIRGRIGVENRITLRELASLKKKLPRRTWKITHNLVEDLRAVKTPQEIAAIKKGARIIDQIFAEIVKGLKRRSTRTEEQIVVEIGRLAKKFGADGLAFDPIVAWGGSAAAPHHNPGKTKIGRNNFLLMDFGVVASGMHSDFTRTLFLGKPQKRQEAIYNAVLAAQEKGIRAIKVGRQGGEIDKIVRTSIADAGYGEYFTHSSGHGVGLEIHELPNLSPGSDDELRPGMVVTIEPGIYIEKKGGVRIEDMVLLGETPQVMSKIPKNLKSMIVHV